ncbi:hypothetical protein SY2F82_15300 [Streptomyces sp. Y2F8-2]|uniref:hypothetical protein n=1 Tax=Streptomyces sp. Y2F8-2 TaxID=2759675 RepID=UPI001908E9FE|nr:hypothetical protein [Streptomyces sp. Y2F8-2]GHJ99732.1 hypothetical protein SY2F82_15300 [Streptomyces sp. Y2F8-2]
MRWSPDREACVSRHRRRTYGHPGAYAVMQTDGNFVVYTSTGGPGKGGGATGTTTTSR